MENGKVEYIEKIYEFKLPLKQRPVRLDVFLTNSIENATRSRVQRAIDEGYVTINGKVHKSSKKLLPSDYVVCKILKPPPIELIPENIPLEIAYEDEFLLVANKQAGICTHPGFGNRTGTLINAVLWHLGQRESIKIETDDESEDSDEGILFASDAVRPGMVHRLDKDTSGLIVVSKDSDVLVKLQKLFFERKVHREYNAIVWGAFDVNSGTITGNIGRSVRNRKIFEVQTKTGKHAITDFEVLERFQHLSLLKVKLRTGRTHQIRVHFSHNKHPVFGDVTYKGDSVVFGGHLPTAKRFYEKLLSQVNRQMLHAKTLGFVHPVTKEELYFQSELPSDMKNILNLLRDYSS